MRVGRACYEYVGSALGGAQRLFSLKKIYARNGILPPAIGGNNELFVVFNGQRYQGMGRVNSNSFDASFLIFYG